MAGQTPFWGEIHTHTGLSDGNGSPEDNFDIAQSHLDFWAMADHACDEEVFNLDYRERNPDHEVLNEEWGRVQELCRSHEDVGQFIPFLAYEWTNYQYGHHNVYYLDYDQPIRMPATLPELYDAVRDVDALVIPHHSSYPVGICGKNWDFHDEALTPFVEIYSLHGSSEEPRNIEPLLTAGSWMGPGAAGGSVQDGLARGYKLGIMASSDSHGDHPGAYDNGLIAAYADELSRPALWEAFRAKRVYGVTGDRITLDFSINGSPMGTACRCDGKRAIDVSVVAWDKIDRIDIIKNNTLLHSVVEPTGPEETKRMRFMVEWGWDSRGAHEWSGSVRLSDGRILQVVPCFRGSVSSRVGTGVTKMKEASCSWTSRTEKLIGRTLFRHFADGLAFEVECGKNDAVQIALTSDGLERTVQTTPAEILAGAAVAYMADIPPTNNGAHWHGMETCAKLKIHQGYPTGQLTGHLTFEDDASNSPKGSTDFYYARIIQKNGQRAWSSPVWVEG